MTTKEILNNVKIGVLEQIYLKLKKYDETEIYFHDIIHGEIDSQTPQNRKLCLKLIDLANEEYFDTGLIDESSLDRSLITRAYCSIEQNLFNDNFIQRLQEKLNNEVLSQEEAKELLKEVEKELISLGYYINKTIYKDNSTQVFLKIGFSFKDSLNELKTELLKRGIAKEQIINLSDSLKILISNKRINQNALVIEEKKDKLLRVYLMDKDKKLDMRALLKFTSINRETGFNLSPDAYREQTTEQYDKNIKKDYLTEFKDKNSFINQVVHIVNKLLVFTNN